MSLTLANFLEVFTISWITDWALNSSSQTLSSRFMQWEQVASLKERYLSFFSGEQMAWAALLLFFPVGLFKALSLFSHSYTASLLTIRISQKLRESYFCHIHRLSLNFFSQYEIGTLSSRIVYDSEKISEAVEAILTNYLQLPVTLLATLSICFFLNARIFFFSFIVFPLLITPILFFALRIKKIAKKIQENREDVSSLLVNLFSGIQTVKLFCMETFIERKYLEKNREAARLEEKNARYDHGSRPMLHFFATLAMILILIYALYFVRMSLSEVIIFSGSLHQSYEPIKKFNEMNLRIQRGVAATERMEEILSIQPVIQEVATARLFSTLEREITFRNLSFSYTKGGKRVLDNLSFSVKRGEVFAIVGPNGSGKSTLLSLISRLFDPEEGEILLDDHPLSAYSLSSLRQAISFIPQRLFLFGDTVENNISCGQKMERERIKEAAHLASADSFIREMERGYQSLIEEQGRNLSGGQRQKLVIARALAKRASILLIDEPTSSLDKLSESHIQEKITSLRGNVTQIWVTHHLPTLHHVDRLLFLKEGKKVAEGTLSSLLDSCAAFRHFWQAGSLSHSIESVGSSS